MWNLPYWVYLACISAIFVVLERIKPWRRQAIFREGFDTDLLYLAFNGHLLAQILAPAVRVLSPFLGVIIVPLIGHAHAAALPLWAQAVVAFFAVDFIKWCVHVTLHHVSFLWALHRVHHSIVDMDWIGNMRFHWAEIVIYDSVLFIPMFLLGFDWRVLLFMTIFSTIIGHFNHSNLKVKLGPLKYLLNHPGMHIWHHDYVMHYRAGCNFGINLSLWDWIFRTAYYPTGRDQPERLGFSGIDEFPKSFVSQQLIPLSTAWRRSSGSS